MRPKEYRANILHSQVAEAWLNEGAALGFQLERVEVATSDAAWFIMSRTKPGADPHSPIEMEGGLTVHAVQLAVAAHYMLRVTHLLERNNRPRVAEARHVAMYLCRKLVLKVSYPEMAQAFERDHTTVLEACSRIRERLLGDAVLAASVAEIELALKGE